MDQPTVTGVVERTFELVVRWSPQTGQLQVGGSEVDLVTKMGMLEAAKAILAAQAQGRPQSPVIVPGRFVQ